MIGTNPEGNNFGIYRRDGNKWTKINGSAYRIAVDNQGKAWVVNKENNIFKYNGQSWDRVQGAAKDIAVGADNTVYVIGTKPEGGGYAIYRYDC